MHKLSFRAWDKKNKYMFYAGSLSGVSDFYMARHNEKIYTGEEFYNRFSDVDYDWMQDTGAVDKNDRNIFDGDIVKCDIPLRNVFYPEYIGVVSIDLAISGKINIRNKGCLTSEKDFIDYIGKLEVIGNIYENPELISMTNLISR